MDITPLEAIPISQFRYLQSLTITKWRVRKLVRRLETQCHFTDGNKIMYSNTSFKNVLLLLQYLTALAGCRKHTLLAFYLFVITNESRWRRMSNLEQTEAANSPTHFVQNIVFPRPSRLYGGRGDLYYPKSTLPMGNSVP
jgi:hypothetical protein